MFYVYIIQNERDQLYYGYTSDLKRRFVEHNSGQSFSTKGHRWRLVYYEAYLSEQDARQRERQLKRYGQAITHLKRRIKFSLSKS